MLNQTGVQDKPKECSLCPNHYLGTGFCPDFAPKNPKMMLLLESPFSDDVINHKPLSGSMGDFIESRILSPVGLKRDDLLISNVLRCKYKNKYKSKDKQATKLDLYPSGKIKKQAENACRVYDVNIRKFNPTIFLFTFSITDTYSDPAFLALLINDLKRAKQLTIDYPDDRICVCLGREAIRMVFTVPFRDGKGGIKAFRGSYIKSTWNF